MITKQQYIEAKKVVDAYKKELFSEFRILETKINNDLKSKIKGIRNDDHNFDATFWVSAYLDPETSELAYEIHNNADEGYWGQRDKEIKAILRDNGIAGNYRIDRYVGQ